MMEKVGSGGWLRGGAVGVQSASDKLESSIFCPLVWTLALTRLRADRSLELPSVQPWPSGSGEESKRRQSLRSDKRQREPMK